MAQSVLEKLVFDAGLSKQIGVSSAGTHANHSGERPDARALAALQRRGYESGRIRSRRITPKDFQRFDLILAMDTENLAELRRQSAPEHLNKVGLFLDCLNDANVREVPDPYYGNAQGFEHVLDLCELGAKALLKRML
jgi:protein-tyrosine phosphatase